ncbi:UNVERIFIED_CONTAM: CASP-like protein 1F1 [Sesamum calycinum]|uniref:CASP-like protein n=1 Tax=Sesamum calycinum TaxID=2727403 RepID=A0AAW2J6S1_9LAMI
MAINFDKSLHTPPSKTLKLPFATQVFLRLLAIAATSAAACVMLTTRQTTVVYGIQVDARYSYSSAFNLCPYSSRGLTVPQFENEDRSFSSIRSKSMAKAFSSTIIALLSMIFICSSAFAESGNSPFIVAHKRVSLRKLNSDLERVSVSIDIYNAGSLMLVVDCVLFVILCEDSTAYDVTLTDDSWAEEVFDSVIGNTSKTWERLESGSLVSHSFELESKVKTVYYGAPALITYRIPRN